MKLKNGTVLAVVATFALWGGAHADDHNDCADLNSLELKVKDNHLALKDKTDEDFPACIALGGKFTIKVKATGGVTIEKDDVTANEVAGAPLTISGDNAVDEKLLVIHVTGDSAPSGLIKYEIHVDGIGMLDPRVRVVDVEELQRIQLGVLKETIENWDIGTDVLEEAIRWSEKEY